MQTRPDARVDMEIEDGSRSLTERSRSIAKTGGSEL
jgi:hypothetical protein